VEDAEIIKQIGDLADEERRLEEAHVGEGLSDEDKNKLRGIEVTLDQLWDLLRQRRALRDAGNNPDRAVQRSEETVEHFQQ
jgi:hypothetical protein